MCGIVGITWKDEKLIKKLARLQKHRGPDQEGHYTDQNLSLGHQRLSIIDLSTKGTQPFSNHDETLIIVYNGEVYNYQELRKKLEQKGHTFTSKTDTEVILYAHQEYGISCLDKLNGQFSFCIYDKKKKELFLARDRLGIKPLYYAYHNNKFIFSSELKSILSSTLLKKEIHKEALNHYLHFGYTPRTQSIIKEIKKLAPGHYLQYSLNKQEIQTIQHYWKPQFETEEKLQEKTIQEEIIKKLRTSVQRRMISDRPVGAFLSGGLDSSLITALMKEESPVLETFSIGFDNPNYDESIYAKEVAQQFNTTHHDIRFSTKDIKKDLAELYNYFDEPFANPSTLPTYLLAKKAKKHVTVALVGTGGDELFSGYPRYRHYALLRHYLQRSKPLQTITLALTKQLGKKSSTFKKLHYVLNKTRQEHELYPQLFSSLDKESLNINTSFLTTFKRYFTYHDVRDAYNFDQNEYLPGDLLWKDDMSCLAHALEIRVPFLDHELVEYANTITPSKKMNKKEGKLILKKAAEKILTKNIIYRKKQSFNVPLVDYLLNDLKEYAHDLLFNFNDYDYYNKETLRQCWNEHQSKKNDYSHLFYTIMMFNLWYKKWMTH